MVLSDDLAVATLEHRWITPATSVGTRNDVRGIVTFQLEVVAWMATRLSPTCPANVTPVRRAGP